jgi:hypothetical protein
LLPEAKKGGFAGLRPFGAYSELKTQTQKEIEALEAEHE